MESVAFILGFCKDSDIELFNHLIVGFLRLLISHCLVMAIFLPFTNALISGADWCPIRIDNRFFIINKEVIVL